MYQASTAAEYDAATSNSLGAILGSGTVFVRDISTTRGPFFRYLRGKRASGRLTSRLLLDEQAGATLSSGHAAMRYAATAGEKAQVR